MIKAKVIRNKTASKEMKKLFNGLDSLENSSVATGYFDGEMHNGSEMALATLMTLLEYGSNDGKIPARFPFSTIASTNSPKRDKVLRKMIEKGITTSIKEGNTNKLMGRIGKHYLYSIRQIFGDTTRLLSNAALTQKLKGKDSPLIEEGELLSKLSYRIIK